MELEPMKSVFAVFSPAILITALFSVAVLRTENRQMELALNNAERSIQNMSQKSLYVQPKGIRTSRSIAMKR